MKTIKAKSILFLIAAMTCLTFGRLCSAMAAGASCEHIFSNSNEITAPKGLLKKFQSERDAEEAIRLVPKLFKKLVLNNTDAAPLFESMAADLKNGGDKNLRVKFEKLLPHTNYALFRIDGLGFQPIYVRFNGEFMFLSATYKYRDRDRTKKYKAVGYENGKIKVYDQAELVLSTLSDKLILSRNMSDKERENWIDDKPFFSRFGTKVHFAPNHFRFEDYEPYLIEISKQEVLDFYRRGELELNIYDPHDTRQINMPEIGIEFEYVFQGDSAIENLRPIIKDQIRQKMLDLPMSSWR